ncbi:MAG: oligosaccharyl transferase, archaeosortase A system-associated [Dehalococcoidia bacterium]|nr:oligosaccharyl transferase, archaeosortase A system-associated [Dehalococcoidia bacterium]MDD5493129.1 oligosaccharyl transferase, archaeosortase A system-associated [Dehalococcoidia bacterium]
MKQKRTKSWLIAGAILFAIILITLWLRIVLPYPQVFVDNWVKLTGVDAYYYMRLVDNLVRHFPNLTQFDPYFQYPGGWDPGAAPNFFAYFMGAIIWMLGLGTTDQHTVDVIAVYIPPVLAALTVIAVFFIGKTIGGKWMGLLAAGLLAIIPGEFLNRSLLGNTDHHVAEVLFSSVAMMFVFMFIHSSERKSFAGLREEGSWKETKLLLYGILGGVFLGTYLLTWAGALLFVLIFFVFIVVQAVIEHMCGRSNDYLGLLGLCIFGTAFVVYLPWARSTYVTLSLMIAIFTSILLVIVSRSMLKLRVKSLYYPVVIISLGIIGCLGIYLVNDKLLIQLISRVFSIFIWSTDTTVFEMQPLLWYGKEFTFSVVMQNYATGFILSMLALVILIYRVIKNNRVVDVLLAVWSVIILLAALSMKRFAYYFDLNVALLTGYLSWIVLSLVLTGKVLPDKDEQKEKQDIGTLGKKAIKQKSTHKFSKTYMYVALLMIFLIVYYPDIGPLPGGRKPAIDVASKPAFLPADSWCESLDWLRLNTPEPLGDADDYYGLYQAPHESGGFSYPSTAYGVLSWWDYGYLITRIGRRIPHSNPGIGTYGEANYFIAQDQESSGKLMHDWGIKYVVISYDMTSFKEKFYAMALYGGHEREDYYDFYLKKTDGGYDAVLFFYPDYYRTMAVRLFNFNGEEVVPAATMVVDYSIGTDKSGKRYKVINEIKKFDYYSEAMDFIEQHQGNYRIIGTDPGNSPVPLEKLSHYELVYGSSQQAEVGTVTTAGIKIFEYTE